MKAETIADLVMEIRKQCDEVLAWLTVYDHDTHSSTTLGRIRGAMLNIDMLQAAVHRATSAVFDLVPLGKTGGRK